MVNRKYLMNKPFKKLSRQQKKMKKKNGNKHQNNNSKIRQ